jgi:hypothetical protein
LWLAFDQPGLVFGSAGDFGGTMSTATAYCPAKRLRHLAVPSLTAKLRSSSVQALGFDKTVQNEAVQAWLLSLYSKRAIAKERAESAEPYSNALLKFERALQLIYGDDVGFEVDIEPTFQPRLRMWGRRLNFSQLPDGVRGTVGWIADFMMREDVADWASAVGDRHPRILLLDEAEQHLHPRWQRKLLPALREALPDVQIIVSSHSPFVISSCATSKVHVFELDSKGHAHNHPAADAPNGTSIVTTLRDIFGVESRFDIQTERELNEWNELKKLEVIDKLRGPKRKRFLELTSVLSLRSEELRSLVGPQIDFGESVLKDLLATAANKRRKKVQKASAAKAGI